MPVHNTPAKLLEYSILSCLNQTCQDFELLIIDASTSQETLAALNRFKNISRVKLIKQIKVPNQNGISAATNTGIRLSSYDLIVRMDSDDVMFENKIEKQLRFLNQNPETEILGTQIRFSNNGWITAHPSIIEPATLLKYSTEWFINNPTVMFRKSVFSKVGYFDESQQFSPEDYDFYTRCVLSKIGMRNLDECLLDYNWGTANTSARCSKNIIFTQNTQKLRDSFLMRLLSDQAKIASSC